MSEYVDEGREERELIRPLLDPEMDKMWDDPEMRFAMLSVVVAAKLYVTRQVPELLAVLENTVALADDHLRRWNEDHPQ